MTAGGLRAGQPQWTGGSETALSEVALGYSLGPASSGTGVDEVLFREAEARRQRREQREEEAEALLKSQREPRLGRASRAICRTRLEKEVREAFVRSCPSRASDEVLPREYLPRVLAHLGLINGNASEAEDSLCTRLGLLLDSDNRGVIVLRRLCGFLVQASELVPDGSRERALKNVGARFEECLEHLENNLSRTFSRLLRERVTRPRATDDSRCAPVLTKDFASGKARSASSEPALRLGKEPVPSAASGAGTTPHGAPQHSSRSSSGHVSRTTQQHPGDSVAPLEVTPCSNTPRPQRVQSAGISRPSRAPQSSGEEDGTPRISRCDLLYHQAVFASRECANLEEEIKDLKRQEEMRECTFKPKLCGRRPASPRPQPRNFEAAVDRMRSAHKKRIERQAEDERIPKGENYERLRRLGAQPFACASKTRSRDRREPLMYVDVTVRQGRTGRIALYEGDNLKKLCKNFAKVYQLAPEALQQLEGMLQKAYEDRPSAASAPATSAQYLK